MQFFIPYIRCNNIYESEKSKKRLVLCLAKLSIDDNIFSLNEENVLIRLYFINYIKTSFVKKNKN